MTIQANPSVSAFLLPRNSLKPGDNIDSFDSIIRVWCALSRAFGVETPWSILETYFPSETVLGASMPGSQDLLSYFPSATRVCVF